jgi:hypothetical protein
MSRAPSVTLRNLTEFPSGPYLSRMATPLKRLLTVSLALVFLIGVTAQLVPSSMAETPAPVSVGTAGCCDTPQPPCTGHLPNCLDHGGCVTIYALSVWAATLVLPVAWTALAFDRTRQALSGLSVKPELSPPILVA